MPKLRLIVSGFVFALVFCAVTQVGWSAPESDTELLQRNRPRIFEIMASVARPDGRIDKATHDALWALLPASIRENPKSFTENLHILRGITFQKELWESIRLSVRAKRIVKTVSYNSTKIEALSNDAAGRNAAIRADQMIAAAANGMPFQGSKGQMLLSEDTANQVLDGLNGSFSRLQRLVNPVWRGP